MYIIYYKTSAEQLLVISGNRIAACLSTAGYQRVATISMGTFANGHMTASFTLRIHSALVLAGINALVVATSTMIGAVLV